MKRVKGYSVLLLCLVFLLTACSGGNNAANSPKNNPTAEPAATEAVAEATAEPTAAPVDMGGRVIKVAAWWDLKPAGNSASEKERLAKIAEVEEKYNCKFEFVNVPFEEFMPKFTATALTGEPFADIVIMEYNSAWPAILKGQLMKVSEFTTAESNINNEATLLVKAPQIANEYYAFAEPGTGGAGLHYNRDLFKKLGLPDLQEVYASGQWTWDKFIEIAKQATKDTDNDGKIDTYGFSGWAIDILRNFSAANGGKIVDEATGTQGLTDPKVIETAEFINRLYNVENVMKVKGTDKVGYDEFNTFKDGDVAMFPAPVWNLGDLTFDFGIVPFPNGPSGSPEVTYADNGKNAFFIPKGVKDPAAAYQAFEETYDITQTGDFPSQEWLESIYAHEEDVAMLHDHINNTGQILLETAYPDFPTYGFMKDIIVDNQSVTATAEKYKPEAEASIAKLGK
ncbi:ABC transporter substrate-binding protein [Paenibacillus sp. FSL R7-0273]|uniref:ABC transporter substrate-binding protein n=1 Tax=Paenibacillus sp. FSL R7-0273 TaxID=1536772 RepID=UPI0004F5BC0F|nr:extracellular solute-binding protein [Paenibacillus sp. FSL R7-0273]AIQ45139.1 ABC transporter substrate-binding protein [Paenibacillus sp. FSL R7-0273]OMF86618.1 ABC transporter substrate-binding protein [Paenibacillus sp. FSL R7-0273]